MPRTRLVALPALLIAACLADGSAEPVDGVDDTFALGKADGDELTTAETAGVLAAANTATLADLDDTAGLDARAASGIVARRPFADLAALDAVPYVGPVALDHLLAFAYDRGLVVEAPPPAGDMPCLIISEYIEGSGNYNKGLELWNCGTTTIDLTPIRLCLVRDNGTTCGNVSHLGEWTLAPGAVRTVCRTKGGTWNDPMALLRDRCQSVASGLMTFSGNDRIVVFRDNDRNERLDPTDTITDAFGWIAQAPATELWANMVLRRCNPERFDGSRFFPYLDYFERGVSGGDHTHYGVPPNPTGCN
jgi:hypothetical protein